MAVEISPDFVVDEKDMPATENAIAELFEGIDAIYFLENGFKAISNEMEKLSGVDLEIDELERERFKLKRQMQVVSKKVTSSIVKNSFEFNKSVESYETIRKDAEEILLVIRKMRKLIGISRRKCKASAAVLSSEFKRVLAIKLKEELEIIRTLRKSECRMKELIQEGDVFAFVQVSVEALHATKRHTKYSSVKQVYAKLLRLLELEESKLDALLALEVTIFMPERYAFVYSAYNLIGAVEKLSAKLQEFFKASFCHSSRNALIEMLQNISETERNLDELSFEELTKLIEQKYFLRALREIGSALVNLLANYHAFLRFHIDEDRANCTSKGSAELRTEHLDEIEAELLEAQLIIVERGIVQKCLIDNMHSIFGRAASYYNSVLSNFDLTHLKFDHFLKIIDVSEKFRKFGQRHFANPCPDIAQTLQNQSNAFFKQYHSERIDELKMFLENEAFTLCPVSIQFTLFDLTEFHFLKCSEAFDDNDAVPMVEMCFEVDFDGTNDKRLNFLLLEPNSKLTDVFPPLEQLEESPTHSLKFQNSISCDTPEEDDDPNLDSFPAKSMPNLCNTALNLLRIIGRYIKMSKILQCTSELAIDAILQLYNYFIYTLYQFFCLDFPPPQQQSTFSTTFASLRLRQLIESINKTYFCGRTIAEMDKEEVGAEEPAIVSSSASSLLLPPLPNVHLLNLDDEDTLFLLAERIIGIESGIFLSKQMELLRPVLETLVQPKKRSAKLDPFYKTLPTASDLLEASVGCVAARALPYGQILKQLLAIDWNIGEIPCQHSAYVDTILKEFDEFKRKFGQLHAYVHVSEALYHTVWSMLSLCTMRVLVQGYSETAKKCTTEGRALQLLDFEQLCNGLEQMTAIRPLPHRHYVENYIKAFYLPQDELNQWIVHHTEYTLSQTSAILNAASTGNGATARKTTTGATMSRIMLNLLDASGIGDGGSNQ